MSTREIYAEMGFESGFIDDPHRVFVQMRRDTPVRAGDVMIELGAPSFLAQGDPRPMFTLFRYDDIAEVLRDAATFSSKFWEEPGARGRQSVLTMDGEEHRSWRTMLTPVFGRNAITAWNEQVIRPVAQRLVEELAESRRRVDLVDYAHQFPMHMTHQIIGLDSDDPDAFARFQEMAVTLMLAIVVNPDPEQMARNVARARKGGEELSEWVVETVKRRRLETADGADLISHVIRSERDGGGFADEEIALFIRTIATAAVENTTRQFLNTMTCLLERPELLNAARDDRSLVQLAMAEAERYEPAALTVPRLATRDVEIRGTLIPAGAFVLLVIGSGNRDPDAFTDPDTFDVQRKGPSALTFGLGRHRCPGINLARAEIAAAIGALLDRLPNLRLDPEQEPPRVVGAPLRQPQELPVVWD